MVLILPSCLSECVKCRGDAYVQMLNSYQDPHTEKPDYVSTYQERSTAFL